MIVSKEFIPTYRCYHPWQSLMVSADGGVQPCAYRGNYTNTNTTCRPYGNINDQPLLNIWNNAEAQKVRAAMAKGDLDTAGCGKCLAICQGQSLTLEYDPRALDPQYMESCYSKNFLLKREEIRRAATILESKPTILNYTPSHRCNLSCIHCYQNITRKLTIRRKDTDKEIFELLPFLNDIVVGGGEPFILPVWHDLLNKYKKTINPFLRFSTTTNATILRKATIEQLGKFDRLQIIVSLDGPDKEIFERIRVKSDWKKFERNARTFRKLTEQRSNASSFGYNISVMKSNIEHLPNLIRYCAKELSGFNLQPVVTFPLKESLRIFNNPKYETRRWKDALDRAEQIITHIFLPAMQSSNQPSAEYLTESVKDLYLGHIRSLRDLIPWDVLDRPHYPIEAKMPKTSILIAKVKYKIISYFIGDEHMSAGPLQIGFFEIEDSGNIKTEAHHWAYLESDNSFKLYLPDGIFMIAVSLDRHPILASNPKVLHRLVVAKGRFYFEYNNMDRGAPCEFFKRLISKG